MVVQAWERLQIYTYWKYGSVITFAAKPDEFSGESAYLTAMTSRCYEISEYILQFYKESCPNASVERLVRSITWRFEGSRVLHRNQILPLLRAGYNPFIRYEMPTSKKKIFINDISPLEFNSRSFLGECDFLSSPHLFQLVTLRNYYSDSEINEIIQVRHLNFLIWCFITTQKLTNFSIYINQINYFR